jgi:hypothetical protein
LPSIRTAVGSYLLDGQTLDWKTDESIIQAVLEFVGVAAVYNELVATVNSGQALTTWSEYGRRHWYGQLLGAYASLLAVQRRLLEDPSESGHESTVAQLASTGPGEDDAGGWTIDCAHSSVRFSAGPCARSEGVPGRSDPATFARRTSVRHRSRSLHRETRSASVTLQTRGYPQ